MKSASPSDQETSASPPDKKRRLNTTRTSQACTRCRSLKMKCIGATDPPCRRCRRTGATCDFVPRANAARPWSPGPYPSHTCTELWRSEVNQRLKTLEEANARLEALLGQRHSSTSGAGELNRASEAPLNLPISHVPILEPESSHHAHANGRSRDGLDLDVSMPPELVGVLSALERLKRELPSHIVADDAWATTNVCRLWESFRDHMPGLHFFSGQVSFVHPTPLLAVSILYVAAAHYPSPGMGQYQPVYFAAFTRAVGTLAVPDCPLRGSVTEGEDGEPVSAKFDDVLGIILVGLMGVGWVDTVGMWVNTAYRLLLDGMAEERSRRLSEWRSLWEGLRTIELEHSSLHLICPALPRSPPDPPFTGPEPKETRDAGGSIGQLLAIMQRCMPRFVGRGLPTVWETVCVGPKRTDVTAEPEDMAAIQAWAAEIDAWYRQTVTETINASLYVRSITLLNYHLHKLFVLSVFFPLRGISYTSASEREELLQSSRVVLKIESSGFEVWSSWDLVMVTNASLILLHAYSQGAGVQEDIDLIQNHLNMLTCTHQTAPSLRHTLSTRLETALQAMRTPVRSLRPLPTISPRESVDQIVDTWQLAARSGSGSASSGHPAHASGVGMNNMPGGMGGGGNGGGRGQQPPDIIDRSGFLFMDQAPDLDILPNLPNLDVDSNAVAEWPPFLLNLFGYDGPGGPPAPAFQGSM